MPDAAIVAKAAAARVFRPQSAGAEHQDRRRHEDETAKRGDAVSVARQADLRRLSKTVSAASFAARLSLVKNSPATQSAPLLAGKRRPRSAVPQVVKTHAAQDRELRLLEGEIPFLTRGQGIRDRTHLKLASQRFLVQPSLVDLGTVRIGDTATASFTIQNTGASPSRFKIMPVRDLSLVVKLGANATRIAAGMRETVTLEYTAERLGLVRLCLVIQAGELERFHIPVHGSVVEQIPEPFSHTDPDSLLAWIPRLPGTYFNWKTEELVVERDSQTFFDADIPGSEIAERNERLRGSQMKAMLPAYCVRVDQQGDTHHDPALEDDDALDPGIRAYLADVVAQRPPAKPLPSAAKSPQFRAKTAPARAKGPRRK